MEIAVLALGCFWGPEQKFGRIDGIIRTEVGYCGGKSEKQITKMFVLEQLIMLRLLN